jgi:threonine aldolase
MPPQVIDLRSDTITQPTAEMRQAMAAAHVGDDVMAEDPTVNELEKRVAKLLGKEAALYVPSGTMANLLGVMIGCPERGSEFIVGSEAHIHEYEGGGAAWLGGAQSRIIENRRDGTMCLKEVERKIRDNLDTSGHYPRTRLICLENTQNRCCGAALPQEFIDQTCALAKKYGLKVHMDGARLMNAVIATKTPADRIVRDCDTVSLCLSKGLGSPAGSLLVSTKANVALARRYRKALGGGMRQAGVLAACGLISIEKKMIDRLQEDHDNAQLLAQQLKGISGITPRWEGSNIVYVEGDVDSIQNLQERLKEHGILCGIRSPGIIRMVTTYHVNNRDVERITQAVRTIMSQPKSAKSKL